MCSKFEGGDVVQVVKAPPVCQTCKILLFHLKTVGAVWLGHMLKALGGIKPLPLWQE